MSDIGELVVRIKADATQLQQEMAKTSGIVKEQAGKMEEAVGSLKEQFKELIPAITVASVLEFAKSSVEAAAHINTLAQRIGFAGETLSALNVPLKQNGSNVDEFASSMNFMSRNIELAAEGNQDLIKRFDSLGLSVLKLKALTPEQQFFEIARALGQLNDQGTLTADALAIMGRGAAGLISTLKETKGNIQEVIDKQKELGNTLGPEQLAKVREFDDAYTQFWEHLKIKAVEATLALHDYWDEFKKVAVQGMPGSVSPVSTTRPKTVGEATFLNQNEYGDEYPDLYDSRVSGMSTSAKGSNAGLLTPPKDSALKEYIANLKQETDALGLNERALFVARAEIEASAKAKEDFNNHLRDSKTLLPDEKANVDALAGSFYDLKKAQEENARVAKMMQDALSDSLADIAVNFKSLQDTATSAIQAIAKEIIKMQITDPLSKSIVGSIPSLSGLGSFFGGFFADGGDPPVGVPSVVGENGPELFVPKQSGTVIPNGMTGGTSVTVYQTFHMQPGLPETVAAAIRQSAPQIAAMAHSSIAQDIQNGGALSRIVGRKS